MELCIDKINPNYDILINNSKQNVQYKNNINTTKDFEFPAYNFYNSIAFCGGRSMNLNKTKERLDELGTKYPKGIEDEIKKTLSIGNPENKTLIDIQKDYYSALDDCQTLDKVKEIYPEFSDVKSDEELPDIMKRKGTFYDKVKNGKIDGLDKDTDISLQLLQLYWGQGFPFGFLSKKFHTHIFELFKEDNLNIPTADTNYAIYLKLSDKDYNSKYTAYITQRAEQKRLNKQKEQQQIEELSKNLNENNQAETIVTTINADRSKSISKNEVQSVNSVQPKREITEEQRNNMSIAQIERFKKLPMTDEHKKNISIGMTKYINEHPEIRERQSEIMTQVLLRAWNYPEGHDIRIKMSKFMKNNSDYADFDENITKKIISEKDTDLEKISNKNNLEKFWKRNPKSLEAFSKCMTKSWARQKELLNIGLVYEPLFEFDYIPEGMKRDLRAKGIQISSFPIYITDKKDNITENCERPGLNALGFTAIQNFDSKYTKMIGDCSFLASIDTIQETQNLSNNILNLIYYNNEEPNFAQLAFLLRDNITNGNTNFPENLRKNLDKEYEIIKNMNEQEKTNYIKNRIKKYEEKNMYTIK